jgi:hypothetical protein
MKPELHRISCLLAFLAGIGPGAFAGDQTRQIGRTTEKEVSVVLSSAFGSVIIDRGEPEKILVVEAPEGNDQPNIQISYAVRNRVGYLELEIGEVSDNEDDKKRWDLEGGEWLLHFSDALPISFDVELSVGKGHFDLSGLQVKDFTLSTGASDVTMTFDEENDALIEGMSIESGVGRFSGTNLGNANFRQFRFEGGVGTYYLDFSGSLRREVDVDIEVGLGVLTLVVPELVGARLSYEESWISRLDCGKGFTLVEDGEYITENYSSASGRMNIRVESGFGSVRIHR